MNRYFKVLTSIGAALFICFLSAGGAYAQDCAPDSTPPTVTCGPPTTVFTDTNGQAAIPNLAASVTATDNCTAPASLIRTQSPAAGTLVGLGTHTITVTVTDAARNSNTCLTTLTVAAPGPTDVRVVNAPTEPVATVAQGTTTVQGSVRVEGTPNVNVANTATVNLAPGSAVRVDGTPSVSLAPGSVVSVAGTPTVNLASGVAVRVDGTPTVALSGTPTVGLAPGSEVGLAPGSSVDIRGTVPVTLVSTPLKPLSTCSTCETDNAVRSGVDIAFNSGESFKSGVLFTVPPGRRLVIEFVTVDGSTPHNQRAEVSIVIKVNGNFLNYSLQLNREDHQSPFGQRTSFENSQLVRIYADGGTDVLCSMTRTDSSGSAFVQFRMSGYLVDMP